MLSAFLQSLYQVMVYLLKEEQSERHLEEGRKQLVSKLGMIQAALGTAEKKTQLSASEEAFFASLKDVSYQGSEALDEYCYEVQRRKVIRPATRLRNSTVTTVLNPSRAMFRHNMENKFKDFADRIDGIRNIQEMLLDLQAQNGQPCDGGGNERTSLLPPTVVCGRHGDEEKIVEMLLRPDPKPGNVVAVLPIVGEAYIGKTTVAQLVLKAERVAKHFELKLWVHVTHQFSIERIFSSIIESIQCSQFQSHSLNTLHTSLDRLLRGRRYLLVLDDYWNESWEDWDMLKRSFLSGAPGSKIIVTTRSENVAGLVRTLGPHRLQRLEEEDCLSLFSQCAQGTEHHAHVPDDTRLKEEVLRKCRGVPFIAASLGYTIRLRQENDRSKWADILREEKWDSSTSHFNRALRLSYVQLDYHLKPCFAYSSIIPHKFQFEKEWLIRHWMAQGFIPDAGSDDTVEDTGRAYFKSLVSQSFFQIAHVDRTGEEHRYVLSEMMHDLASNVSGADCGCYLMGRQRYSVPVRVRHLTVVFCKDASQDMFQVISCGESLHTLIALGGSKDVDLKIPDDIDKRYTRLRALDLSNFGVTALPRSIGKLKHLRCLQLQGTRIRCLPESICELYNLQTLGLRNCYELEELPHDLKSLRKLRHIDLLMAPDDPRHKVCSLRCMPKDIGLLTNLQTLSRFVVSERSVVHPHRGGIGELADLNDLRGELLISNMHLVKDVQEATQAQLSSKRFLQKLELSWDNQEEATQPSKKILQKLKLSPSSNEIEEAEAIVDRLKAPTSIKELTISGYTGMACPSWLGSAGYADLVTVSLCDFKRCDTLPCLGLLSHLENLHLKGWDSLVSISCREFCGDCFGESGVRRSFRSLKKLHFEGMTRLQRWEGDGDGRCALSSLLELVLENCCMLEQVTHSLPSLAKITVTGSVSFRGLRNFPSLKRVNVDASGDWIWGSWPRLSSPTSITLCNMPTVNFPPRIGQLHTSLQRLEISHCEQLQHIPEDWPPCTLTHFCVRHCPLLRELPEGMQRLQALEDLEIVSCGRLTDLPDMGGLDSLVRLEISDCGSIKSLPNGGLPSSVQVVSINNCPLLANSCINEGSAYRAKVKRVLVWIDGLLLDRFL